MYCKLSDEMCILTLYAKTCSFLQILHEKGNQSIDICAIGNEVKPIRLTEYSMTQKVCFLMSTYQEKQAARWQAGNKRCTRNDPDISAGLVNSKANFDNSLRSIFLTGAEGQHAVNQQPL